MIKCNLIRQIETASDFNTVMQSKEDKQYIVMNDDDFIAMIFNPTSWRFDGCYSVGIFSDNLSQIKLKHKNKENISDLTEFHNEINGANFIGLFEEVIKKGLRCKVYEIDGYIDIKSF